MYMNKNNILSREDLIISEENTIEFVLNENYNNLFYTLYNYLCSLLLDIRLENKKGYSFYNNLIDLNYYIHYDISTINHIKESKKDMEYLESLILKKVDKSEILELFYNETIQEYKNIEYEIGLYIENMYNILKSII